MPQLIQVGDKLPAIQSKAKLVANVITSLLGAGLITLAVALAPDDIDGYIISAGGLLTLLANALATWGTTNTATVPLEVNPAPGPVGGPVL